MHHIPRGLSRARLPCPAPLRSGPQAAPAPDTLLLLGPQHSYRPSRQVDLGPLLPLGLSFPSWKMKGV